MKNHPPNTKKLVKTPQPIQLNNDITKRPQDRSLGYWTAKDSVSYQYKHLLKQSPQYLKQFKPETIAQAIALNAVKQSLNDLPYLKEVTDRTEGRAPQAVLVEQRTEFKVSFIESD